MTNNAFNAALEKVLNRPKPENSIGVLSEKTVHAVLKNYYSPNESNHEVNTNGFIADICHANKIIEIQTRNFNTLRRKLDAFLPDYDVTIVHPITRHKTLHWINPETGEISKGRRSPKKGSPYMVFKELYRIKPWLTDKNLHIRLVLMDIEEYKMLDGRSRDRKKGATRNDGIPVEFVEEIILDSPRDYLMFLPIELPENFTSTDLGRVSHLTTSSASLVLNILNHMNVVEQVGKRGRSYLYRVIED